MTYEGLDPAQARAFAGEWLPAWSGNRPEVLVAFYTDDAFYADPGLPTGIRGRDALLAYFTRLLERNPRWVWTHRRSLALPDGFLNFWHASIPAGERTVEVDGVCSVQLRGDKIYANEVFFDRAPLLSAIAAARPTKGA